MNTYGYVGGSALHWVDTYGLSPSDVLKIKKSINKSISNMTSNGERLPDKDKNNRCRMFPTLWGKIYDCGENPEKLKDCGDQVDDALEEINKNKFDDRWWCSHDTGFGHAWGFCVATTNDTDPILWFDPRANQISENKPCSSCKPWFGSESYGKKYIRNLRGSQK